MAVAREAILKEALALSPAERAALIDELYSTLDQPDPAIDQLWAEEAQKRIAAVDSGEMETYSGEEVLSELRGDAN